MGKAEVEKIRATRGKRVTPDGVVAQDAHYFLADQVAKEKDPSIVRDLFGEPIQEPDDPRGLVRSVMIEVLPGRQKLSSGSRDFLRGEIGYQGKVID